MLDTGALPQRAYGSARTLISFLLVAGLLLTGIAPAAANEVPQSGAGEAQPESTGTQEPRNQEQQDSQPTEAEAPETEGETEQETGTGAPSPSSSESDAGIPDQIDLEGTVIVLPDEQPPVTVDAAGNTSEGAAQAGGVFIATEDDVVVEVSGLETEQAETGALFEGEVDVPDTLEASANSEEEVLELAEETEEVLEVTQASLTQPRAAGPGSHQVDVVWLKGPGSSAAPSVAQLRGAVDRAGAFWRDQSEGVIGGFSTITPRVVTSSRDVCDAWTAWREGQAATGRVQSAYTAANSGRHLITVVSRDACEHEGIGLGTVGGSAASGGLVWVAMEPDRPDDWHATLVHELGHNFGLHHSGITTGSAHYDLPQNVGRWNANHFAALNPYGDYYDVMGAEVSWHVGGQVIGRKDVPALNLTHKVALGAFQSGRDFTTVKVGGGATQTFTLNAASESQGVRGLKISDPQTGEDLYVDYRSGFGPGGGTTEVSGVNEYGSYYATSARISPSASHIHRPGVRVTKSLDDPAGVSGYDGVSLLTRNQQGLPFFDLNETYTSLAAGSTSGVKVKTLSTTTTQARIEVTFSRAPSNFKTAPPPTITGTAKVGRTLTANPGTWSPAATITYQWLADGTAITGATGKKLTLTSAHRGKRIKVKVTGKRAGYETRARTSSNTTPVAPGTITRGTATISGTRRVGETLTAKRTKWSAGVKYKYQWYANGKALKGRTGKTLKLTSAHRGKRIKVKVTASKAGYATASKVSAQTNKIAYGKLTSKQPVIMGTAKRGRVLTASVAKWKPAANLKYQWYANGKRIKGATKAKYKVPASRRGQRLTVKVTGSKAGYKTVSRTSKARRVS